MFERELAALVALASRRDGASRYLAMWIGNVIPDHILDQSRTALEAVVQVNPDSAILDRLIARAAKADRREA